MSLEHLPIRKVQAGTSVIIDHLLLEGELYRQLETYLLTCEIGGKSQKTLRIYGDCVRALLGFIHSKNLPVSLSSLVHVSPVSDTQVNEIMLFLKHLIDKGLKPHSIHVYFRTLKTFFLWLQVEKERLDEPFKNPMNGIPAPKLPKLIRKILTPVDISHILSLCAGSTFLNIRNRALVLLLLDTALRLEEISNIQLSDINLDTGLITVMGKGKKERTVKFGKVTKQALGRYILHRTDDYDCLWVTEEQIPMRLYGIQICIRRLMRRARVSNVKIGPHTFRHTASVMFIRNGGDLAILQKMLGHENIATTMIYLSSLGVDDLVRVHRKVSPVDNLHF
jgi:site-specific recombinase XerD